MTEFDYEVLDLLDDWKSATDIARELHVDVALVKESLERLLAAGKVWHDGPFYINRYGVMPSE